MDVHSANCHLQRGLMSLMQAMHCTQTRTHAHTHTHTVSSRHWTFVWTHNERHALKCIYYLNLCHTKSSESKDKMKNSCAGLTFTFICPESNESFNWWTSKMIVILRIMIKATAWWKTINERMKEAISHESGLHLNEHIVTNSDWYTSWWITAQRLVLFYY